MSRASRYAVRFRLNDSETTLEVWNTDYEAACREMRDTALGLAARLQEWATSPEGHLYQTAVGAEPYTDWPTEAAGREWQQREQALLSERGGLVCLRCPEWNPPTANYCGACGASLRFWCIACHQRLPDKKHGETR